MPPDFCPRSSVSFNWFSRMLWALLFPVFTRISNFFESVSLKVKLQLLLIPKITFMNSDPSYSFSLPIRIKQAIVCPDCKLSLAPQVPSSVEFSFWAVFDREC